MNTIHTLVVIVLLLSIVTQEIDAYRNYGSKSKYEKKREKQKIKITQKFLKRRGNIYIYIYIYIINVSIFMNLNYISHRFNNNILYFYTDYSNIYK